MNIIILSGGEGKQIWPLSNEARSKQFLRLLPDEVSGESESMIQRVVRQIRKAGIEAPITIATNEHQQDSITAHLGHDVDIVTEPSRRDTFPAVCLACEYLSLEKGISDNEIVVVMPCDQFTELGYYEVVAKMALLAERPDVNLVVMGIEPDYTSSKFGYIITDKSESETPEYYHVKEFREKPSDQKAKRLIKQGAFWNGGVFAFKLGFLKKIAGRFVNTSTFDDVRNRYDDFPAISFDYEVAENTSNVLMVPFSGLWKDLGTWESLLEEVEEKSIGKVTTGDNKNTHVLNELKIPILCVGTRNLVVAASLDGILIADKGHTESIKEYSERFKNRPMFEERRWGTYHVIDHTSFEDGYETLTKRLTLRPSCSISYQRHTFRDETWTFIDGEGIVILDNERRNVKRGDTIHIRKGEKHALMAKTPLTFIEVQAGSNLVEEDIERFPFSWESDSMQ